MVLHSFELPLRDVDVCVVYVSYANLVTCLRINVSFEQKIFTWKYFVQNIFYPKNETCVAPKHNIQTYLCEW